MSPYFLILTYCFKIANLRGILRNYDPVRKLSKFCHLTYTFTIEYPRSVIIPYEYNQPVELPILGNIHGTKFKHKF